MLKAMSDETRLRILNILNEKELCVCDITEALEILQTKASRHLSYLKKTGLISSRKNAQWVYYSLIQNQNTEFVHDLIMKSLRGSEPYENDLISLSDWLKRKNIDC